MLFFLLPKICTNPIELSDAQSKLRLNPAFGHKHLLFQSDTVEVLGLLELTPTFLLLLRPAQDIF